MTLEDAVEQHQKLVYMIAHQIKRKTGADFEELVGYGNIGLLEAAKRFDESRGVKFASYAATYIRGYMLSGVARLRGLSIGHARYVRTHKIQIAACPMDEALGDVLADDQAVCAESAMIDAQTSAGLRACLASLQPRDRELVTLRYIEGLTLREIGDRIGCSRTHANNQAERALSKLRRLMQTADAA